MATTNSAPRGRATASPKATERRAGKPRRTVPGATARNMQQMLQGAEAFRRMAERIGAQQYIKGEPAVPGDSGLRTDYRAADEAVVEAFAEVFGSRNFSPLLAGFLQALSNTLIPENRDVSYAFGNMDAEGMLTDGRVRGPEDWLSAVATRPAIDDSDERTGALAFLHMLRAVRATPEVRVSDAVRKATQSRDEPDLMMYDYAHADAAVAQCLRAMGTPDSPAARGLVKAFSTHLVAQELVHAEYEDADDATEVQFLLTANGFRNPCPSTDSSATAGHDQALGDAGPTDGAVEQESPRAKHVLGLFLELQNEEWALAVALGNAIREECWNGSQREDACPRLSLALSGMLEERLARMEDTLAIGGALGLSEAAVKELAYQKPQ
jgi:hypothetical protein